MGSDGPIANHVLLGGGIGAGKSVVADVFVQAGFLLIEADAIGAEVLRPDTASTRTVAEIWPDAVNGGVVDRKALARIVFSSSGELRRLEAITHPAIAAEIDKRVAGTTGDVIVEVPLTHLDLSGEWIRVAVVAAGTTGDVIVEVPLTHLDLSGEWIRVAVVADEKLRITRAAERGGHPVDVRRRVLSQVSEDEWMEWADYVIDNNHLWSTTEEAVHSVIREVRE